MTPPSPWRARISAVAGGGAALAATLIVLWLAGRADPPPGLPSGGSALTRAATAPSASGVPQTTTRLPVDPHTAADPFLTPDLRYQIEAMLLDAGDATTPEELKLRLSQLVRKHFGADLATRALALAERYVDYRVALGTLKAPRPDDPTALRNSLNARERLRERYFAPEEHEALFARESALDRYTLARLEIQHNNGLTKEEKARALKDAEAELPPEQRADRAHAVAHQGDRAALQGLDECHAALRQAFEGVGLNRRAVPITGHVPRHGAVACAGQHLHLGGKGQVIAVGVVQHQHRGAGAQDRESRKQSHTKKSAGLPAPHARAGGTP